MTNEQVKAIIDRKSSIPLDNETFEDIEKAYDIASEIMGRSIAKPIKPRRCWNCQYDDCLDCDGCFNRCPNCNEVLDTDCGEQYKFCPDCGQALIW